MSKYRIQKIPSILIIAILAASSLTAIPLMQSFQTSDSKQTGDGISVQDYDKMKNCTTELDKRPTSIEYLTYFNCGRVSTDSQGNVTREFTLVVKENQNTVISTQGNTFEGWTFNGTIPGPTMRMTEGDHVKITLINSKDSKHAHSLHMHSIHPASMDGVEQGIVEPGHSYTYDFIAQPFGLYPYHCHVDPVEDHINRGLYGMMIIDPKTPRPPMKEMAMLMNGYDLDYKQAEKESPFKIPEPGQLHAGPDDRDNEIYSVNGKAFDYVDHPINLTIGEPVRIYLVNMLEFDPVNSFHLHGNMFNYYPSGTSTEPEDMNDIVTLSQGDRGIIEFTPEYPGRYMFHAHQTEFTEKGWMGFFDVGNQTSTSTTSVMTMGGH
jgi:FtsP/CotA-like multicopper oxidase with cupredoxin domain